MPRRGREGRGEGELLYGISSIHEAPRGGKKRKMLDQASPSFNMRGEKERRNAPRALPRHLGPWGRGEWTSLASQTLNEEEKGNTVTTVDHGGGKRGRKRKKWCTSQAFMWGRKGGKKVPARMSIRGGNSAHKEEKEKDFVLF